MRVRSETTIRLISSVGTREVTRTLPLLNDWNSWSEKFSDFESFVSGPWTKPVVASTVASISIRGEFSWRRLEELKGVGVSSGECVRFWSHGRQR